MKILDYKQMLKLPAGVILRTASNSSASGGSYQASKTLYVTTGENGAMTIVESGNDLWRLTGETKESVGDGSNYERFDRQYLAGDSVSTIPLTKTAPAEASQVGYHPLRFYLVYEREELESLATMLYASRQALTGIELKDL